MFLRKIIVRENITQGKRDSNSSTENNERFASDNKVIDIMAWLTGYPREKVNWFPTVDLKKCVKCGMCMNCGKNVYDWTKEGPKIARPYNRGRDKQSAKNSSRAG